MPGSATLCMPAATHTPQKSLVTTLLVLADLRQNKKQPLMFGCKNSLPKRGYRKYLFIPYGQNVTALLVVKKDRLLSVCVHVLHLRKARYERLFATRWTARNPMLLLALPLLLFAENNPAFELLFELPPRIDHGLSASTKFELSEPHDWSLLVTD